MAGVGGCTATFRSNHALLYRHVSSAWAFAKPRVFALLSALQQRLATAMTLANVGTVPLLTWAYLLLAFD